MPPVADAAPAGLSLRFPDGPVTVPLAGSTGGPNFKVNLDIAGAQEVKSVPFQLKFDPESRQADQRRPRRLP